MSAAARYLTTGTLALRIGLPAHRVANAVRHRDDCPGMIRLSRGSAFDESRIEEVKDWLRSVGAIREEYAATAG